MQEMPPLTHSSHSDNDGGDDDNNDVEFRKQFQSWQSSSLGSQPGWQSGRQYTNAKNVAHQQHFCCVYRLRMAKGLVVMAMFAAYILTLKLCFFFVVVIFCCIIIIL